MNNFIFDLQLFADDDDNESVDFSDMGLDDDEPSRVISSGDVTISAGGAYTIESGYDGEIYVMTGDAVTLDGSGASSLTSAQIYTGTNAAALTLNSVSIANPNVSPLKFGSGGGTLTLVGENVLSTENFYASAVNIGSGNVTIDGAGTLTATASGYGAAVGTDYGATSAPTLTIANGTISVSANYGAGLGSGFASTFGTISVTGGTVNATSTLGAGIGTGAGTSDNSGSVAITGGKVTATSKDGAGIEFSEEKAKEILLENEIEILVALGDGNGKATAWGCDLTYDYVKINGDYRT